jgi:hypothetical protein
MKHLLKRCREGCYHRQHLGNGRDRQTTPLGERDVAAQMRRSKGNLTTYVLAQHDDAHAAEARMEPYLLDGEAQPIERMRRICDLDPLCIAGSALFRGIILGWI